MVGRGLWRTRESRIVESALDGSVEERRLWRDDLMDVWTWSEIVRVGSYGILLGSCPWTEVNLVWICPGEGSVVVLRGLE